MKVLEEIADRAFPLMLFTPLYCILLLTKCSVIVSLLGAFVGSFGLMFLASAIDSRLYIRRLIRELREFRENPVDRVPTERFFIYNRSISKEIEGELWKDQ